MGIEQTLDGKTGKLLECKEAMLGLAAKTTYAARGKQAKVPQGKTGKNTPTSEAVNGISSATSDSNRTLFSPESLERHKVPGYGGENVVEEELEI